MQILFHICVVASKLSVTDAGVVVGVVKVSGEALSSTACRRSVKNYQEDKIHTLKFYVHILDTLDNRPLIIHYTYANLLNSIPLCHVNIGYYTYQT